MTASKRGSWFGNVPPGGVGGPVGPAEERVADRCVRWDAQRVGEDCGWCFTDEFAPYGQPGRSRGDAKLAQDLDGPAVAAVFAGSGNAAGSRW